MRGISLDCYQLISAALVSSTMAFTCPLRYCDSPPAGSQHRGPWMERCSSMGKWCCFLIYNPPVINSLRRWILLVTFIKRKKKWPGNDRDLIQIRGMNHGDKEGGYWKELLSAAWCFLHACELLGDSFPGMGRKWAALLGVFKQMIASQMQRDNDSYILKILNIYIAGRFWL